ncbi:MAG TPA: hypothetical protein VKR21_15160 [Solirubrobacteraceae bacterium]|nr:hypothetical protein [Solirubrobacteraceae bacterium]
MEQALVRLEQAMAAASRMSSDPDPDSAPIAALQVDATPAPAELRPAPRDVARLEDVLTIATPRPRDPVDEPPAVAIPEVASAPAPVPETPIAPVENRAVPAPLEAEPSYVEAQALREAFWFEQASARLAGAAEPKPQEEAGPAEPRASVAPPEPRISVAPPEPVSSQPDRRAQPDVAPSVVRVWAEPTSQSNRATALFLLALLALVLLLTGRAPRR